MSPTYEEFDALVGPLKRASIDAYMHDHGFRIASTCYSQIQGRGGYTVSRPGPDGSGGGQVTVFPQGQGHPLPQYDKTAEFNEVRSQIDEMVEKWRYLPSTASLSGLEDRYTTLNARLAGTASFSEQYQVTGVGIIATNLEQVRANAGSFTGRSAEHFKSDFLWRIGAVGGGIWAASVLGTVMVHLARVVWEAAEQDVVDVLDQGRIAMEAVAHGGPDVKFMLKVVGALAEAAGEFIPGVGGAAATSAGIAIDLAVDVMPNPVEAKLGGARYELVRDNIATALNNINSQVTLQEKLIESTLLKNLDTIQQQGKSIRHPDGNESPAGSNFFDLKVPPISSTNGITITSYGLLAGIWQECLPKIAQEYEQCAIDLRFILVYRMLFRSNGIGHLPSGFDQLGRKIDEIAQDLAWDVRQGAKDLELLVQAMREHDEATADRLRDFAKKMSKPSPYDPWD